MTEPPTSRQGEPLPASTRCIIIGAGFAGAATAWALARTGHGPGLILEREFMFGVHASGRNAAIMRLIEADPVIRALATRSDRHIRALSAEVPLLRPTGGYTLASGGDVAALESLGDSLRRDGVSVEPLTAAAARARVPALAEVKFDAALWSPAEAVVEIHELLSLYLERAGRGGFRLHTKVQVDDLIVEGGRVSGVHAGDRDIKADVVIDASGAWAGRLGRAAPLPLRPLRRHLFVTGPAPGWHRDGPVVWIWESELYARPEGEGVLISPCDETLTAPIAPDVDPAAIDLLAEKVAAHAPGLQDLELRRAWACLRTFAPDRRPVIGADPDLPGLFHVSGLGGFGMSCSAAVGELAAATIADQPVDWIDAGCVSAGRCRSSNPLTISHAARAT